MPSTRRTIGASTYNGGFDFDADFSKLRSRKKLCFFPKSRKKNAQRVQEQETTTLISGMDAAETLRKRAEDEEREQTATKKEQQQRQARGFHRVQEELFFKDEHFVPLEEETNIDTTSKSTDNQEIPERLQRPIDPPDILAELHGLPLVGFEKVAEERAVALVSTWLFDNGLLDELMDHGGMRKSTVLSSNQSVVSTGDSVRTSEGIELGVVSGLPVEGVSKLDYHISSLMASTQRKLAFYNSQLSDGHIVPTGDEIRELVQAIHHNDQDDIGRLGELSTYLHYQHGGVEDSQLLANYPKLKQAHNARRNLKKCFQELELFYTQIPDTCQHLRLKLQTSRGDPFAIRDVCSDCVDLEAFLLEVEVGMKLRTEKGIYQQQRWRRFDDTRLRQRILHNHNRINSFLFRRAKDVWDLVGEIRRAIIAGIGRTFERAMQNHPEELKALVEAVELHEALRGKFKTEHGKNPSRLVDIRCTALKHLNEYFEQRGIKVFWAEYERAKRKQQLRRQEDKDDDESDAWNDQITAVLSACNHLTSEIAIVRTTLSPCLPPVWALDILWTTRVVQIFSKQILVQIGGLQGNMLKGLTVTQLLDLVAWVENFRQTLNASFPNLPKASKGTYLVDKPQLLKEGNLIDFEIANDALAWANNMLWEVHDLAKDEFLFRTKEQTDEWLDNVYDADHPRILSGEGRLLTSLCEDVYSLFGVQLRTIRERLTSRSEALVQAIGLIFKNLYEKQIACRNSFLLDFETCCAASNDFLRMSEKCEETLDELVAECDLRPADIEVLNETCTVLLGLYSSDAIFAAQKIHLYIFEDVEKAIAKNLFKDEWVEATYNQFALTLVRTIEDYMGDLQNYLDKLMVGKSLDALVKATVIFYAKCLIRKSTASKYKKKGIWRYNQRALDRMRGDISVMKDYFESLVPTYPSLKRTMDIEFQILDTIHELLMIAAGLSRSTGQDFIIFLQKHIKNSIITRYVVGDLWHLVNPTEEKAIYELVDSIEEELLQVAPNDEEATQSILARQTVPGLRLDFELAKLCDESRMKRKRPGIKRSATERGEIMLNKWKATWEKQVVQKLDLKPTKHMKQVVRKLDIKPAKHMKQIVRKLDLKPSKHMKLRIEI